MIPRQEDEFGSGVRPRAESVLQPGNPASESGGMAKRESADSASRVIPENRDYNGRILGVRGWFMNSRARIVLPMGFLLLAMLANAVSKSGTIRIKVLDSETHSVTLDSSDVPKNCDQVNYDAYCLNSKTAQITSTLLVQEGDGPPFHITCTNDSKWSRCLPLPKGESFDARREKRGLVVYYADDKGKVRGQLYTYVAGEANQTVPQPAAQAQIQPGQTQPSPAPTASAAPASTAATAPASAPAVAVEVKCSFSSTPSGADITLDGRYVGSTPSVLNLSTGKHVVVVSTPGFAQWKRELAVSPGSELTVNAVLEKTQ